LREIEPYGQSHTLDELREHCYQDQPLGASRGALLLPAVGKVLRRMLRDEEARKKIS
jgi:hypothetical protein